MFLIINNFKIIDKGIYVCKHKFMILDDRFYTSTEVAEILGVSLRSVYRYLEENKIKADVKTATGRHRFTRQNILDFLYPEGEPSSAPVQKSENGRNVLTMTQSDVQVSPQSDTPTQNLNFPKASDPISEPTINDESPSIQNNVVAAPSEDIEPEPEVDWLAKFRAAAQKHREEAAAKEEEKPVEDQPIVESATEVPVAPVVESVSVPVPEPRHAFNTGSIGSIGSVSELNSSEPTVEVAPKSVYYYTSGVGGLKDIAQEVNRSARKSAVPYAFTMNAGLSLHKLIRPFSVLHIYARENDIPFFERALELSESDEDNAQLVIFVDRSGVLTSTNEVHGLHVVSNQKLKADLINAGEIDLANEIN